MRRQGEQAAAGQRADQGLVEGHQGAIADPPGDADRQQHRQAEDEGDAGEDVGDGEEALHHFLQNVGVSTTSRVKISSRPSSITAESSQVWKSVRAL